MFKGLHGLNPGNQAFKQFKCPVLNVLTYILGTSGYANTALFTHRLH